MNDLRNARNSTWCIVVADDHGPEWSTAVEPERVTAPLQYCRFGESSTLLQIALRRAASIAPTSQILATLREDYREHWEFELRQLRPENRFVSDNRSASLLATAAALLSIAAQSPSNIVAVLPTRCYVANPGALSAAIDHGLRLLPGVPEGVVTLGMLDIDAGIDEDCLLIDGEFERQTAAVRGLARRPVAWVAHHLKQQGALVASGILIGYAGVFAAHISRHWPGLTLKLAQLAADASTAGVESEIPCVLQRGAPSPALRFLRWHPPSLPQRAIRV
ncbi:MAG: hypothetical protein ABSF86_23735, partial [Steroidobacteraceae bacterium]